MLIDEAIEARETAAAAAEKTARPEKSGEKAAPTKGENTTSKKDQKDADSKRAAEKSPRNKGTEAAPETDVPADDRDGELHEGGEAGPGRARVPAEETGDDDDAGGTEDGDADAEDHRPGADDASDAAGDDATDDDVEEKKEEPRSFKVKVDGEEREVKEDELIRGYQKAQAADKRLAEATQLREDAKWAVDNLLRDPFAVMTQLYSLYTGDDHKARHAVFKLAEKYVGDILQEELMPEGDKARVRAERERDAYKSEYERERQARESVESERVYKEEAEKYMGEVRVALKEVKLPEEDRVVKRISELLYSSMEDGLDLTAREAAVIVKKELDDELGKKLPSLSYDEILTKYPELLDKLRKEDLERLKAGRSTKPGAAKRGTSAASPSTNPAGRRTSSKEPLRPSDIFDF
jgi:hypothetical protein